MGFPGFFPVCFSKPTAPMAPMRMRSIASTSMNHRSDMAVWFLGTFLGVPGNVPGFAFQVIFGHFGPY